MMMKRFILILIERKKKERGRERGGFRINGRVDITLLQHHFIQRKLMLIFFIHPTH